MKHKLLSIIVGLTLLLSLSFGGSVMAQTSVIQHHTGDILVYDTSSNHYDGHQSFTNLTNLDQNVVAHYTEQNSATATNANGKANVVLVNAQDLNHIPAADNPTNDPNFPAGATLFGMQVQNDQTVSGNNNFTRNDYDQNSGWMNNTSPTNYFGPDHQQSRDFQAGIAMGQYSLLPVMDTNNGGNSVNGISILDILNGNNHTEVQNVGFNLFDQNWVNFNVNTTYTVHPSYTDTVYDYAGNAHHVEVLYGSVDVSAYKTNIKMYIPLGDQYDPNTPWIQVSATVNIQIGMSIKYMIPRDTGSNGLFFGFVQNQYGNVWGGVMNGSTPVYFPNATSPTYVSFYSDFSSNSYDYMNVYNRDFIPVSASTGTSSGLTTGDNFHFTGNEATKINFNNKVVLNNGPNGDGPDFNNIQYNTTAFQGSETATQDVWASVYNHNSNAVGLLVENLLSNVALTDSGSATNQGPTNPVYTVQIIPLINGDAKATGVPTSSQYQIQFPVDSTKSPGMSELLMNNNNNGPNQNNDNPLNYFFQVARMTGNNLAAPKTDSNTTMALQNINVNGYDYVVVGENQTYVYSLSLTGSVPYDLSQQPPSGSVALDQTNSPPPATMDYSIHMTVVDTRVYDNATGALIFKGDYTTADVNTSITADLTGTNAPINSLLVAQTSAAYSYKSELSLKEHSVNYQVAQDPTDIPTLPNTSSTSSTNNGTSSSTGGLGLPLPGFELPMAVFSISFAVLVYKKKYN